MTLQLLKLTSAYQKQFNEMMEEWTNTNESIIPYAIRKNDYNDFEYYLEHLEIHTETDGLVPDSVFFCYDTDTDTFVGAVNIRHKLNAGLLKSGGHIGDGVRPSRRREGIATKMIGLALQECKKLGIQKVLMCCDKDNIGSAKSILNNGGVLKNEIEDEGTITQRYWITLK